MSPLLITILGPTATGKTALAAEVAYRLQGEILSADSRQVFRGMDIGTGKDLEDYRIHGVDIPYHLIDICSPGEEYSAYRFVNDFSVAFDGVVGRGRQPVLCGGTGLYLDAVLRGYQLADAPIDPEYRRSLEPLSDEQLTERLAALVKLHNHTDTETRERLVRALEIQEFARRHPEAYTHLPEMRHLVFGLLLPRQEVIARIESRLRRRMEEGMTVEVQRLLDQGVPAERLMRYGLEYRHVTRFLLGECTEEALFRDLFTDIRRFAKRQMTWFRRMERNGVPIHWLDGTLPVDAKAGLIMQQLTSLSYETPL
ncbi:MAG: tRNA (adenosine(37)-N6)-dimethylallyltransferase MiaA [Bacteroidales bacterium]|nr:tRNA (adenosine(37)-N6)-dimethylallyltransferase MiaA [Bacteroidales bacterium]